MNKVTNRTETLNTHDTVDGEEDIDSITLTVRLATGPDAMDTSETSIKYLSGDSIVTLTNQTVTSGASSATNDSAEGVTDSDGFGLSEAIDDDSLFGVLSSMNDYYEVTIDTAAIEASDGDNTNLIGGPSMSEQVILRITPRTGGTTQVTLIMPQQLASRTQNESVGLQPGTETFLSLYQCQLPSGNTAVCSERTVHNATRPSDAVGRDVHTAGNVAAESGR